MLAKNYRSALQPLPPTEDLDDMVEAWHEALGHITTDELYGVFLQALQQHRSSFLLTTGDIGRKYVAILSERAEAQRKAAIETERKQREAEAALIEGTDRSYDVPERARWLALLRRNGWIKDDTQAGTQTGVAQ